ncbi:MAG: cobalamin biosynthesis protein [Lachnospiraceae bacterium]|nr:cobalamin biosynthesis protein [Lachnospiraceae bacterium]
MIVRIVAFTKRGWELAKEVEDAFPEHIWERRDGEDLHEWVHDCFSLRAPILFIGAAGIAVRAIASSVSDKCKDSPVLVMDEAAQFVIPILSGHMGRANAWALEIERRFYERTINGQIRAEKVYSPKAVITTATDVNRTFSVDVFAWENGLEILNRNGIQEVSKHVLDGKKIRFILEPGIGFTGELPCDYGVSYLSCDEQDNQNLDCDVLVIHPDSKRASYATADGDILVLRVKPYVIGVGCKKGTSAEKLRTFIEAHVELSEVSAVASIDLKAREYGLVQFAQQVALPFLTYSPRILENVSGNFSESDFVQEITGVSNVCERAAMVAAEDGVLVQKKIAKDGMTLAIAKRRVNLRWQS